MALPVVAVVKSTPISREISFLNVQCPQDWKRSVFIPIPKKGSAKECSKYLQMVNQEYFLLIANSAILKMWFPRFPCSPIYQTSERAKIKQRYLYDQGWNLVTVQSSEFIAQSSVLHSFLDSGTDNLAVYPGGSGDGLNQQSYSL